MFTSIIGITKLIRKLKVGPPLDPETFVGALISKEHLAKVKRFVEIAKAEGGTILFGNAENDLQLPDSCKNVTSRLGF